MLAHSNEAEWRGFKNNRTNEAFIDRIFVIKVPYCLRVEEETKIYEKLIRTSELAQAPCAPATLEMLARFSVLSRLKPHENSNVFAKMRVYNGESLKEVDPEGPHAAGIQGRRRASTRAWTAFRPASHSRPCRPPSTTTPRKSRPIRST